MHRLVLAALFGLLATAASAQSCREIKFARGASSGEVTGIVSDTKTDCYTFGTGAGQAVRLQTLGNLNICLTMSNIDCTGDIAFTSRKGTYQVNVSQYNRGSFGGYTLKVAAAPAE